MAGSERGILRKRRQSGGSMEDSEVYTSKLGLTVLTVRDNHRLCALQVDRSRQAHNYEIVLR